jgi:hypothetical protein
VFQTVVSCASHRDVIAVAIALDQLFVMRRTLRHCPTFRALSNAAMGASRPRPVQDRVTVRSPGVAGNLLYRSRMAPLQSIFMAAELDLETDDQASPPAPENDVRKWVDSRTTAPKMAKSCHRDL